MSLLSSALQNSALIMALYVAIVILQALAFAGRRRSVLAVGLINHSGLVGLAALLAVPLISPFSVDGWRLFAALVIELFCAAVFVVAALRIVKFLRVHAQFVADRPMVWLLLAKAVFFVLNYVAADGQYGIFSDDSRIDFLVTSPSISKTRYLDELIDFVLLVNVGARCLKMRRVRLFDLAVVLAVVAFGLLTGSKGSTILLTAYALLFLYAAFPTAFAWKTKAAIAGLLAVIIVGYVYLLSELLQIDVGDLINLTLARVILSADARLMALDPGVTRHVLSHVHGGLLAELFRGAARLYGVTVAEYSMGVYQFEQELGTLNYVGSTSQLTALFLTYGGDGWLGGFSVVAVVALATLKFFSVFLRSGSPALAWVSAAALYQLNATLAQGFEAYVQLLPICVVLVLVLWAIQSVQLRRRRRRPAGRALAGAAL